MKIKKSKIVVPALGLLLLSTAASVTGSVAWFTANRTFKMTAGDFAVVNTKNNLQATVAPGIGTALGNTASGEYNVKLANAAYTLTDASFNHNSATLDVIEPDDEGVALDDIIHLEDAIADSTLVRRETNIYSVFTWDITFSILFGNASSSNIGLYFNPAQSLARAVKVVSTEHTDNYWTGTTYTTLDGNETIVADKDNYQVITAKGGESGTGWFTDEECSVAAPAQLVKNSSYYRPGFPEGTYYRETPEDTGKGFRIAFVPTSIPEGSMGYTRVWAPQQDTPATNIKYINTNGVANFNAESSYSAGAYVMKDGKMYKAKAAVAAHAWTAAEWSLAPLADKATNYTTATTSLTTATGTPTRAIDAATDPLMYKGGSYTVPTEAELKSASFARQNYLGYFAAAAEQTVELTYTCVVWYEGTDPTIVNTAATVYETMATALEFDAVALSD